MDAKDRHVSAAALGANAHQDRAPSFHALACLSLKF
jgi:hypothetical protein